MTKMRAILTLIIGVATLRDVATLAKTHQSELETEIDQPMETVEEIAGTRRLERPEVVLQLKYESGELNRIYLAQFRKDRESFTTAVPAKNNLCADLCHAGLGGASCGPSCDEMLPVGLQSALAAANDTARLYGEPRVAVCPTLCHYQLGQPLCNCTHQDTVFVDWTDVCAAFCIHDRYELNGCPPCEEQSTTIPVQVALSRMLDTTDGWIAWCNVQCRQGHGGAACNCDRSAFQ